MYCGTVLVLHDDSLTMVCDMLRPDCATAGMTTAPSSSQTLQSDISQCYGACIMSTTLIDIHAEQYVIPAVAQCVIVAAGAPGHHSCSIMVRGALVVPALALLLVPVLVVFRAFCSTGTSTSSFSKKAKKALN